MGLLKRIFKNQNDSTEEDNVKIPWRNLDSMAQLDEIEKESDQVMVFIFKHSTRCGISRMVLKRFEGAYDFPEDKIKPYFLDLLNHRKLSQEIASRFDVFHESPQLLVLKNGKIVHHASHHGVNTADLARFI